MTERELKILEMQAPSTKACLTRPPDLDLEWLNRPIPNDAQVLKADGSVDLNVREFGKEEVKIENRLRYERGEYIATMRNEGDAQSVREERKRAAVVAFMTSRTIQYVKDAFKSIMAQVKDVRETIRLGVRFREE